jgi:hypothetical protein
MSVDPDAGGQNAQHTIFGGCHTPFSSSTSAKGTWVSLSTDGQQAIPTLVTFSRRQHNLFTDQHCAVDCSDICGTALAVGKDIEYPHARCTLLFMACLSR